MADPQHVLLGRSYLISVVCARLEVFLGVDFEDGGLMECDAVRFCRAIWRHIIDDGNIHTLHLPSF